MRRTTVALDDRLFARVKKKAQREGRQFQECVNELLAAGLTASELEPRHAKPPLPVFSLGEATVDVADRDALFDLMEER